MLNSFDKIIRLAEDNKPDMEMASNGNKSACRRIRKNFVKPMKKLLSEMIEETKKYEKNGTFESQLDLINNKNE